MAWFKVDDNFHSHPKVKSIPRKDRPAALGLWVMAGSWAAQQLTDGAIPTYMLEEFGVAKKAADSLVSAGLWTENLEKTGWNFKDWTEQNPTKLEVQAKRTEVADRVRTYRERKKDPSNAHVTRYNHVTDSDVTTPVTPPPTRPDPTRPVLPTEVQTASSTKTLAARGSRLPRDWFPDAELIAFVKAECPNVEGRTETENFCDYWHTKAGREAVKLEWPTVYRKWMRKAQADTLQRRPTGAGQPGPRRSTTDDRVNAGLDIVRRLAEQEANQGLTQIGAAS